MEELEFELISNEFWVLISFVYNLQSLSFQSWIAVFA